MPGRPGGPLDWDKLRVFHTVAEAGSFTHAGETLNLSQSAVSRQIGALEESLKTMLFHRHARGLLLTEQGEMLNRTVREIFSKLAMAEAQLVESKERPEGPLTVTTTTAFGSVWLTPRLAEFTELYPDIKVEVILNDSELDLSMREADVAIRFMPPTHQDLIQRTLHVNRYLVFAAPDYLKRFGMPKGLEDLDHHRIISYGRGAVSPLERINWLLEAGADPEKPREPILRVNSIYGIFRAVQSGIGIAALPDYFAQESTNLVQVLPELKGPEFDAYFVYPEEMRNAKRITVFRDFLMRKFGELV